MNNTVSNDKLFQAVFTATDEAKERALEILEGQEPPLGNDGPLLLSMGEACDLMGLSRSSLWRLLKSGRLEKIELHPGSFRIRKADIHTLIEESGVHNG